MANQSSRIIVVDSAKAGEAQPLPHSIYAIMYTPSWLMIRRKFNWHTTARTLKTLEIMKEYFAAGALQERPIRAQRCVYSIKTLRLYGHRGDGTIRFIPFVRQQLEDQLERLQKYLETNPVVAWDWIVSWSECSAMAEAFPKEYIRLYRSLRSRYTTKRKPQLELRYFLNIMETVAKERNLDMEYT